MISKETRKRMSRSAKARCTPAWRQAASARERTAINDEKLRELYTNGATQLECTQALGVSRKVIENALKRLGIASHRAVKRDQWGPKNVGWKGKEAGIGNKHRRLYRVCGSTDPERAYDWANLTGDYDNPTDFKRMCRSCHWKYDQKGKNFQGMKGEKEKRGTRLIVHKKP